MKRGSNSSKWVQTAVIVYTCHDQNHVQNHELGLGCAKYTCTTRRGARANAPWHALTGEVGVHSVGHMRVRVSRSLRQSEGQILRKCNSPRTSRWLKGQCMQH